jgi:coenzyme F420-reducing hydrogenase beta subunit
VDGVARLTEESTGVVYTLLRNALREGRLDEVVAVPAYKIDA